MSPDRCLAHAQIRGNRRKGLQCLTEGAGKRGVLLKKIETVLHIISSMIQCKQVKGLAFFPILVGQVIIRQFRDQLLELLPDMSFGHIPRNPVKAQLRSGVFQRLKGHEKRHVYLTAYGFKRRGASPSPIVR